MRIAGAVVMALTLAGGGVMGVLHAQSHARDGPTGQAEALAADSSVDLMAGYWRYHVQVAPAPVDPALLTRAVAANEFGLGDTLARMKIDPAKPFVGWPFYHASWHSRMAFVAATAPPPPGWPAPEFDDSAWPRQRLPLLTPGDEWKAEPAAVACFRARLIVPDPDRVGQVALTLVYRGGVVAYLNGQEIGRGHLPAGELGPAAPADAYPQEAYLLPPLGAGPSGDKPRMAPEQWGEFPGPGWRGIDLLKEAAPTLHLPVSDLLYHHSSTNRMILTRADWNALRRLRDRRIGPIRVPRRLLRKGVNILAIEIHRGFLHPVVVGMEWGQDSWQHIALLAGTVRCTPPGAVSAEDRGGGLAVWVDDIHRRYFSADFGPTGEPVRPLRLVAPRNGVASGQVIVSTREELPAWSIEVDSPIGPAGDHRSPPLKPLTIKADVRFALRHPASDFGALNANREGGTGAQWTNERLAIARYLPGGGPPPGLDGAGQRTWREAALSELTYFDGLTGERPPVPANSCQPIWVTVKVPPDARAGLYLGKLRINRTEHVIPIRLQVIDWLAPDPGEFTTIMALEPSPYALARQYRTPLWSDAHFRLIESEMKLLAQVGNRMVVVPVLADSEFGNGRDSMIRWRRAGDAFACDFTALDRYLDIVARHLKPRCVCFVVCHAAGRALPGPGRPAVVLAGQPGKTALLEAPDPQDRTAEAFWRPLIEGLSRRMADRGWSKAWHWGYIGDSFAGDVARTMAMFAKAAPGVGWARGAHAWNWPETGFTFSTTIRLHAYPVVIPAGSREAVPVSHKGWKTDRLHLMFTRVENVGVMYGVSGPFRFRIAPGLAIVSGCSGIGRWGADFWDGQYTNDGTVGPTVASVLRPGPKGPESSARFECLREGLQETEARIFLERRLETDYAETVAGQRAQRVLDDRLRAIIVQAIQCQDNTPQPRIEEAYSGWQERSWNLYSAAAAAAGGQPPSEAEQRAFFGSD